MIYKNQKHTNRNNINNICDDCTSCSETTIKHVSSIIATGYESSKKSTIVLSNKDGNDNGHLPMNVFRKRIKCVDHQ